MQYNHSFITLQNVVAPRTFLVHFIIISSEKLRVKKIVFRRTYERIDIIEIRFCLFQKKTEFRFHQSTSVLSPHFLSTVKKVIVAFCHKNRVQDDLELC